MKATLKNLLKGTNYEEKEAREALREGLLPEVADYRWNRLVRICAWAIYKGEEAYPLAYTVFGAGSEIYDAVVKQMEKAAIDGDLPALLDLADSYGIYLDGEGLPKYCEEGVAPAEW